MSKKIILSTEWDVIDTPEELAGEASALVQQLNGDNVTFDELLGGLEALEAAGYIKINREDPHQITVSVLKDLPGYI